MIGELLGALGLGPIMAWLGLGAILAVVLSIWAALRNYNRHVDTMACAALLLGAWVYRYTMDHTFPAPIPPPYLSAPYQWADPIVDGFAAAIVAWLLFSRMMKWKAVLLVLLVLEIVLEIAFGAWMVTHTERPRGVQVVRIFLANADYILSLLTVAWGAFSHDPIRNRTYDRGGLARRGAVAHRRSVDAP